MIKEFQVRDRRNCAAKYEQKLTRMSGLPATAYARTHNAHAHAWSETDKVEAMHHVGKNHACAGRTTLAALHTGSHPAAQVQLPRAQRPARRSTSAGRGAPDARSYVCRTRPSRSQCAPEGAGVTILDAEPEECRSAQLVGRGSECTALSENNHTEHHMFAYPRS